MVPRYFSPMQTTTVSELVEAQQVLLQFQLSHERARTERGRRAEELRLLLGGPLDAPLAASLDSSSRIGG